MITNQITRTNKLIMKDDIMFKAFFSKIGSDKYLKDFLSAILGKEIKIRRVIHDSHLEQLARESKYGILDLDIETENGEIINIEMQLKNYNNIEERTTFYASKKVTEQLGPHERYENLKKVIVIAILDYDLIPLPEYVTKTIRVDNKHREYELNNIVTYYYIELKKFREQNPDMSEPINQWLAFIDMERGDLLEMAKEKSKIIKEAYGEYEVLTGDEEVKRIAEIRLMSHLEEQAAISSARKRGTEEGLKQGKEEGLKQGKEEGLKQGKMEEKRNMAKKMLESNISVEQITKITGLTRKEIQELK